VRSLRRRLAGHTDRTHAARRPTPVLRRTARAPIGSASGLLGTGIDTRGPGRQTGGYLIGPGSIVNGAPYVVVRDLEIQPLPSWLANRLTEPLP
jgi:hypothetical protein